MCNTFQYSGKTTHYINIGRIRLRCSATRMEVVFTNSNKSKKSKCDENAVVRNAYTNTLKLYYFSLKIMKVRYSKTSDNHYKAL